MGFRVESVEFRVEIGCARRAGTFNYCAVGTGHAPPAVLRELQYYGWVVGAVIDRPCSHPGSAA